MIKNYIIKKGKSYGWTSGASGLHISKTNPQKFRSLFGKPLLTNSLGKKRLENNIADLRRN